MKEESNRIKGFQQRNRANVPHCVNHRLWSLRVADRPLLPPAILISKSTAFNKLIRHEEDFTKAVTSTHSDYLSSKLHGFLCLCGKGRKQITRRAFNWFTISSVHQRSYGFACCLGGKRNFHNFWQGKVKMNMNVNEESE